ncbi:hypothetical protein MASR2M48_32450 [Spirochaetota bacterium]
MPHTTNYRLLVFIAFMQGFVFYGPVATIYRRAYGLDLKGLFLIESISWVVIILLELPWGRFADRFGYRTTLLLGNLVFLVSKVIFSLATSFAGFLAERLALSIALAALSGCSEALIYRSVGLQKADVAFGRWHAASVAGLLVASLCWPLLRPLSLRVSAYATIVPYALAFVCSLFLIDVDEPSMPSVQTSGQTVLALGRGLGSALLALRRNRALIVFLVVSAMVNEAAQVATVFLAPLQYERSGVPLQSFGVLFALTQGAGMMAAGSAPLARFLGRDRSLRMLVLMGALSLAALALTQSAWLSVLALVVMAASAAMFRPLSALRQNESIIGVERATSLSIYAMVMELVAAVVNVGIGRVASLSLGAGFGILSVLLLCSLLAPGRVFKGKEDYR